MVHEKGAFQIPLQNALLIIQHNWGGIEEHMNDTSASWLTLTDLPID